MFCEYCLLFWECILNGRPHRLHSILEMHRSVRHFIGGVHSAFLSCRALPCCNYSTAELTPSVVNCYRRFASQPHFTFMSFSIAGPIPDSIVGLQFLTEGNLVDTYLSGNSTVAMIMILVIMLLLMLTVVICCLLECVTD